MSRVMGDQVWTVACLTTLSRLQAFVVEHLDGLVEALDDTWVAESLSDITTQLSAARVGDVDDDDSIEKAQNAGVNGTGTPQGTAAEREGVDYHKEVMTALLQQLAHQGLDRGLQLDPLQAIFRLGSAEEEAGERPGNEEEEGGTMSSERIATCKKAVRDVSEILGGIMSQVYGDTRWLPCTKWSDVKELIGPLTAVLEGLSVDMRGSEHHQICLMVCKAATQLVKEQVQAVEEERSPVTGEERGCDNDNTRD